MPSLRSRFPVPLPPTSGSPGSAASASSTTKARARYGAAIALGGLIGFEFEAARTSLGELADLDFANLDVDAHLTTYMFNAVVRLPAGPIQPYATAGVGAVRVTGSIGVPLCRPASTPSAQDFGWNFGGGLYIVPLPFFAIRGDVRRFQTGELFLDDIAGLDDSAAAGPRLLARHGRPDVQILNGDQGSGTGTGRRHPTVCHVSRCE